MAGDNVGSAGSRVQDTYYRRTRAGRVYKEVRERYLRTDVGMGMLVAPSSSLSSGKEAVDDSEENRELQLVDVEALKRALVDDSPLDGAVEIAVIDTNVALQQTDFMESGTMRNVIVTETVLSETRHNNLSTYNRLLAVVKGAGAGSGTVIVFPNEHHAETYVTRSEEMGDASVNDRNDRAIRRVVAWFRDRLAEADDGKHGAEFAVRVVLVTNDRECLRRAQNEGMPAYTVHQYAQRCVDAGLAQPTVLDLLASEDESSAQSRRSLRSKRDSVYPEYLPTPEIERRIKTGKLLHGTFRMSRFGGDEATVMVYSQSDKDGSLKLTIRGKVCMNRAIDGDRVALELCDEPMDDGGAQGSDEHGDSVADDAANAQDGENDGSVVDAVEEDPENATLAGTTKRTSASSSASSRTTYGRVVGIIKRNWRPYCGSIDERELQKHVKSEYVLVVPVDRRIPKIRIRTRQLDFLADKRIVVAVDEWPATSWYPNGHLVKTLGEIGDRETETSVLLMEHDIPTSGVFAGSNALPAPRGQRMESNRGK